MKPTVDDAYARRQVLDAVARLSDDEFQRTVWLTGSGGEDTLGRALSALYDDPGVLPDPSPQVGLVLIERGSDEIPRLRALDAVLAPVRADRAGDPLAAWLADERWPEVRARARAVMTAIVVIGEYEDPV